MADAQRPPDWTREEVEAIVSAYLGMLEKQLAGVQFSKADENRRLRQVINRSPGSIERKHGNISAALVRLGYVYLQGFKPLPHLQRLLEETVEARMAERPDLDAAAKTFVEMPAPETPGSELPLLAPAPTPKEKTALAQSEPRRSRAPLKRNYLELEARNRSLGLAGEQLILKLEHRRLWDAGERRLADRIEHVSVTRGDALGFDILSYDIGGRERLIEVKTTRLGSLTPFFATRNEVAVSLQRREIYRLCRVYNFGEKPRYYELPGSLRETCSLDPTVFSALPSNPLTIREQAGDMPSSSGG